MTPVRQVRKKTVAVIGGGAAGCSAAYALSLSPDLFQVTLFERAAVLGGMATSTSIGAWIAQIASLSTLSRSPLLSRFVQTKPRSRKSDPIC